MKVEVTKSPTEGGFIFSAHVTDELADRLSVSICERVVKEVTDKIIEEFVKTKMTETLAKLDIDKIINLTYLEIARQTGAKVFKEGEKK